MSLFSSHSLHFHFTSLSDIQPSSASTSCGLSPCSASREERMVLLRSRSLSRRPFLRSEPRCFGPDERSRQRSAVAVAAVVAPPRRSAVLFCLGLGAALLLPLLCPPVATHAIAQKHPWKSSCDGHVLCAYDLSEGSAWPRCEADSALPVAVD